MRLICLATVAVGISTAFVPSLVPSRGVQTPSAGQQRNHLRCSALPSAEAVDESTRGEEGRKSHGEGALGVIVCDHGSRREGANTMLFAVAERYRSFSGFDIVEAAHMELAEPSIDQAFDRCVAAGAQKVVLHPFFLSPGRHVMSDIPALMKDAAKRHPQIAWVVSEPLGLQELMPRVMHAAVSESVAGDAWMFGGDGEGV